MEKNDFENRLKNLSSMTKDEHVQLRNEIMLNRPEMLEPWWFDVSCDFEVLMVADGIINYGLGEFGLSSFLTIFKQMEQESNTNLKLKVTLAHRENPGSVAMQESNPDFVRTIVDFKFDNPAHFDPEKYDQIWLMGHTSNPITKAELTVIDDFMVKGGGVFATGDHGNIGSGLSGNVTRVKDMRHWENFGNGEVSMIGDRRNDTNKPPEGNFSSYTVDDQKDELPQDIHTRLYGAYPNVYPHPVLSIKRSIKPSGIIDILPDHPHEGECKPETTFHVKNPKTGLIHKIRTQTIAISFVPSGNTGGYKSPTQPHCFPAVHTFEGRIADVGRIVVDSTWHHFLNINLEGFDAQTLQVVYQYPKNITKWIAKHRRRLCHYIRYTMYTMLSGRVLEASILDMNMKAEEIPTSDLYIIGMHMIDIISCEESPAEALDFCITMLQSVAPELAEKLDVWNQERDASEDAIHNQFVNYQPMVGTALGMGIARLKDKFGNPKRRLTEKDEAIIQEVFTKGMEDGLQRSMELFEKKLRSLGSMRKRAR